MPYGTKEAGVRTLTPAKLNLTNAALYEAAVAAGEGRVAAEGPLVVRTGQHTGRSARDKFVVRRPASEDGIWWDGAAHEPLSPEQFEALHADMVAHAEGLDLYAQDLFGGADPATRVAVRVLTEYAWHSLFIRHLLRRPAEEELSGFEAEYTILDLPSFRADPDRHGTRSETVIACDFDQKIVLIGGTSYAGEMKKSVFTILNYLLPARDIMPMHCSVNVEKGREREDGAAAIFFGLSGTGKTTLSADARRPLIGDDEHGWSEGGLFNFEGGCYAKMIRLSAEAEPEIFATTRRFGTVLENVVMDERTRALDLDDARLAENSRGAYPLDYIDGALPEGRAGHPGTIIMLTADAFGVLPPIARLTRDQAIYHFLSGYTAKVAGTEKGVTEPTATFSACFGAPFMPRHPSVYGDLLGRLIDEHDVDVWLVNTGWTGGPHGEGRRMPIGATRALLNAALEGRLDGAEMRRDERFGFEVPVTVPDVDTALLTPRGTWADPEAYDRQADALAGMFAENFARFEAQVTDGVRAAGPARRG